MSPILARYHCSPTLCIRAGKCRHFAFESGKNTFSGHKPETIAWFRAMSKMWLNISIHFLGEIMGSHYSLICTQSTLPASASTTLFYRISVSAVPPSASAPHIWALWRQNFKGCRFHKVCWILDASDCQPVGSWEHGFRDSPPVTPCVVDTWAGFERDSVWRHGGPKEIESRISLCCFGGGRAYPVHGVTCFVLRKFFHKSSWQDQVSALSKT